MSFTKFDYLLNAFEQASQSPEPAKMGYGGKRRAVLAYVNDLESRVSIAETQRSTPPSRPDENESGAAPPEPKERSTAREAFEKWADSEGYKNLARHNEGRGAYDDDEVLTLWVGWRAALSHRSTEGPSLTLSDQDISDLAGGGIPNDLPARCKTFIAAVRVDQGIESPSGQTSAESRKP